MHILVLTSSYPTPEDPVASAFLDEWVDALAVRGHHLTVAAPSSRLRGAHVSRKERKSISYFQYIRWPAWQTLAYGAGMYDNVCRNPFRIAQLPPFLCSLYNHARALGTDADLIHAHWLFPAGLIGAAIRREIGVPLVITVHSTDFHLVRTLPGGRLLARTIIRHADRLHFVTEYHRASFAAWLNAGSSIARKSYVAPMGISDVVVETPPLPFRVVPRVGFMGRLIPIKGVDRLLRTCARLGLANVAVAGSGPALDGLMRLARDLSVDARFVGRVSGAGKTAFLDSCDVLVFPSRHYPSGRSEGLPVSLLEALARGRVVVASDSGGIPEIVSHGQNGYLFAARRPRVLDDVLGNVVAAWPASTGVAGSAIMSVRRLTTATMAQRHETEYRALVSNVGRKEESA